MYFWTQDLRLSTDNFRSCQVSALEEHLWLTKACAPTSDLISKPLINSTARSQFTDMQPLRAVKGQSQTTVPVASHAGRPVQETDAHRTEPQLLPVPDSCESDLSRPSAGQAALHFIFSRCVHMNRNWWRAGLEQVHVKSPTLPFSLQFVYSNESGQQKGQKKNKWSETTRDLFNDDSEGFSVPPELTFYTTDKNFNSNLLQTNWFMIYSKFLLLLYSNEAFHVWCCEIKLRYFRISLSAHSKLNQHKHHLNQPTCSLVKIVLAFLWK